MNGRHTILPKPLKVPYFGGKNLSVICEYEGHNLSTLETCNETQNEGRSYKEIFLYAIKVYARARSIEDGFRIHDVIVKNSLEADAEISTLLVHLYAKCGCFSDAHGLFNKIRSRDVNAWSALIGGHAEHGHGAAALMLYQKSQQAGIIPNRVTFLSTLKACISLMVVTEGRFIHDQICRNGMELDSKVGVSILDMYAKCGSLAEASKIFNSLSERNVVAWNTMVSAFTHAQQPAHAMEMFVQLQKQSMKPIKTTFLAILKACNMQNSLPHGRLVHDNIVRTEFETDVAIGNALVDMYSKCGSVEEALRVFNCLRTRTVISWGAIIDGFVEEGRYYSAYDYYNRMLEDGIYPDVAVFSSILKSCRSSDSIEQGKLFHNQIVISKVEKNVVVGTAIVNMYAKAGCLPEAEQVFNQLPTRNAVSWGAIISAYAYFGHANLAIEYFLKMQNEGFKPDESTLISTLKACTKIGATVKGMLLHNQVIYECYDLDKRTGTAVVDMYAEAGYLAEARNVLYALPDQDLLSWASVIAGYVHCGELKMARECLVELQKKGLNPVDMIYTTLASSHSCAGLVIEQQDYFQHMNREYTAKATIRELSCIVGLLHQTGCLGAANDILHTMPSIPDHIAWTSLITGCRVFGNSEIGQNCFRELFVKNPCKDVLNLTDHIGPEQHKNSERVKQENNIDNKSCDMVRSDPEKCLETFDVSISYKNSPANFQCVSRYGTSSKLTRSEKYVSCMYKNEMDSMHMLSWYHQQECLASALGLINSHRQQRVVKSS